MLNDMLLQKVREKKVDMFILVVDEMKNLYKATPEFMSHRDLNSYQLTFNFEDWTGIINDGSEHMATVVEYRNAELETLCKWCGNSLDEVLDKVKAWNDFHKIN